MISNKWIWGVALIFFCKALVLAFWITPLWEIPDEAGHFAYARDIGEGKGPPLYGITLISSDVMNHLAGKEVPFTRMNYIAQHPPLYYSGAGAIWKMATYLTGDPIWLFKAPRLMSAISGALTLVVLFYLMTLATGDRLASLGVAASVGFIPMFSHLSSGTSNDTTVTLFAVLAVYFWVRFLLKKNTRDAYFMAVGLSLACVTKMTALVLVPPMLASIIIELALPWGARIRHIAAIAATSLSLPLLWMIRTFWQAGEPIAGGSLKQSSPIFNASFMDYISATHAIEMIFMHFWGMFGSAGKFRDFSLLRIDGWPLAFFSGVSLLLVLILAFVIVRRFFVMEKGRSKMLNGSDPGSLIELWYGLLGGRRAPVILSWLLPGAALILAIFAHQLIYSSPGGEVRLLFFAGSIFVLCVSVVVFLKPLDVDERIVCYSLMVAGFYLPVFLCKLYWMYLSTGSPLALHGRYFFPLIPFMLVAISLPLIRWLKFPSWVPVVFAVPFAMAEMATFLGQVIPHWRNL